MKSETLYIWANDFIDFRDIDKAWMIFTGMNMGQFGLMDLVELDSVYNIEKVYYEDTRDPKDQPTEALKKMIDAGEMGVESGKDFLKP